MPTLALTNLAPGRTATIQRYTRGTQTTVGSAISLANSGYTYSVDWPYTGDFDCVLLGFVDSAPSPFPVRDGVAYPELSWTQLDSITRYDAVTVQPTTERQKLSEAIIIGDDYLQSLGRHFEFRVSGITGYAAADLTCKFAGKNDGTGWSVSGTVADITGGLSLKFDLPKATTASLEAGWYLWSVEVSTVVGGLEVTRVIGAKNCERVELREKAT